MIFFMLYIEPAISMAAMAAPKMVSISCGSGLDHDAQRAAGHQIAAEHAGEKNDDAADLKHGKPAQDHLPSVLTAGLKEG